MISIQLLDTLDMRTDETVTYHAVEYVIHGSLFIDMYAVRWQANERAKRLWCDNHSEHVTRIARYDVICPAHIPLDVARAFALDTARIHTA